MKVRSDSEPIQENLLSNQKMSKKPKNRLRRSMSDSLIRLIVDEQRSKIKSKIDEYLGELKNLGYSHHQSFDIFNSLCSQENLDLFIICTEYLKEQNINLEDIFYFASDLQKLNQLKQLLNTFKPLKDLKFTSVQILEMARNEETDLDSVVHCSLALIERGFTSDDIFKIINCPEGCLKINCFTQLVEEDSSLNFFDNKFKNTIINELLLDEATEFLKRKVEKLNDTIVSCADGYKQIEKASTFLPSYQQAKTDSSKKPTEEASEKSKPKAPHF